MKKNSSRRVSRDSEEPRWNRIPGNAKCKLFEKFERNILQLTFEHQFQAAPSPPKD